MKPNYKPFTRTARRQIVCPTCNSESYETVLMHKKDYIKLLYDPFKRCEVLNVEKRCASCIAEEIAGVLHRNFGA